jgi:hypothetical protein
MATLVRDWQHSIPKPRRHLFVGATTTSSRPSVTSLGAAVRLRSSARAAQKEPPGWAVLCIQEFYELQAPRNIAV